MMTWRNKDEDEDKDDGECNDNGDEGDAVFILSFIELLKMQHQRG